MLVLMTLARVETRSPRRQAMLAFALLAVSFDWDLPSSRGYILILVGVIGIAS